MNDDVFYPDFDLGVFRQAAARYVKLLIRARWGCDPGFLSIEDLDHWGLKDIDNDPFPAWRLLEQAAAALGVLNTEFFPRCGSGGVKETDESTPAGRLIFDLAFLAEWGGGGPLHNGDLLEKTKELREGRLVDWQTLVQWGTLKKIRADLDLLPNPRRKEEGSRLENEFEEKLTEEPAPNSFCRDGDFWRIRYNGAQEFLLSNSVGLGHIHSLISRPESPFTVFELDAVKRQSDISPSGTADGENLSVDGSLDDGEILDGIGMRKCQEELARIEQDLHQAKKAGDGIAVAELEAELRELADFVAKTHRGGKRTKLGSKPKTVYQRVTKAIYRAYDQIEKKDPALEQHFLKYITTGFLCHYSSVPPIAWSTESVR